MAFTFFISEAEVKNNTSISNNLDNLYLRNSMQSAQELRIETKLGKLLVDELKDQIINSTLTVDNLLLLDKIKIPLAYWVWYESSIFVYARTDNNGIIIPTGDNFSAVDTDQLSWMRSNIRNLAEEYTNILLKFLIDNKSLYPLFKIECDDKNVFFTGVYFPKSSKKI